MKRIFPSHISLAALVAFAVVSSGCSWFHHRTDYYGSATEGRPLEVPPDLDTPVTSNELLVPQAGAGASAAAANVGSGRASNVSSAPPAGGASLGGADLHVADAVAHTWQRVGIALDRAQIGAVAARDENAHTYTLEFNSTVETGSEGEHHWYSRVLHPFGGGKKTEVVTSRLTVRVSQDGDGSRVSVEGDATKAAGDSARRVVQVLRERLS